MHVLPFERLDPDSFERLCVWLMRARGYRNVQHLGAAGSDSGRDVVAVRGDRRSAELVYVQCKRSRGSLTAAELVGDVRKIERAVASGEAEKPGTVIFAVTVEPSARLRATVIAECDRAGYGWEFLTLDLLDAEVKEQPGILAEFFGLEEAGEPRWPVNSMRLPPANFVDRECEREELDRLHLAAVEAQRSLVVLLHGMGGVGKSALALEWAHDNRDFFPGGRFHLDLGRWRHDGVVDVSAVVSQLLADLGMPAISQPSSYDEMVRAYRRIVDRRRVALLVDNAHYPAEVLPLSPDSPGSVLLVTSRQRLDGLIAGGATLVATGPLDESAAARLFASAAQDVAMGAVGAVGPAAQEHQRAEPHTNVATAELVRACGGLPIALTACGAQLAGRGPGAAERLLRRTRQTSQVGDGTNRVLPVAIFDASYATLGPQLQAAYRRLLGGPVLDLTGFAAAALLDREVEDAEATCDDLSALSLLDEAGVHTWRGHDLIRQHAVDLWRTDTSSGDDLDAVLRSAARRYAWAASLADHAIVADRPRLGLRDQVAEPRHLDPVSTREEAHRWWLREKTNAVVVARLCWERGWDVELMLLAEGSWPMAVTLKTAAEWEVVQGLAAQAATRRADHRAVARFASQQARALADSGLHDAAADQCQAAMSAAVLAGDRMMEASVSEFTGICLLAAGDGPAALAALDRARGMFAELGVVRGVALQDYYAACALLSMGQPAEALNRTEDCFDALLMAGDEVSVARAQLRRAEAYLALERPDDAEVAAQDARDLAVGNGLYFEQGEAHDLLARCADASGEADQVRDHRDAAREAFRRIGHPRGLD